MDNPDEATDTFCRGYWLNTPMIANQDIHTGYAYCVDLATGNIHPESVRPDGTGENAELKVTSGIGVRPAFAMLQN